MSARTIVLLLVVLVAVSSCATDTTDQSAAAEQLTLIESTTTSTVAVTITTEAPSGAALTALQDLDELVDEWNSNQIDWIVVFQDPDVGLDEYLRTSQRVIESQVGVVGEMAVTVDGLPGDLPEAFAPMVSHFERRVPLLTAVIGASTETDAAFQEALETYQQFTQEDGIDSIELVLSDPALESDLTEEEAEIIIGTLRTMAGG